MTSETSRDALVERISRTLLWHTCNKNSADERANLIITEVTNHIEKMMVERVEKELVEGVGIAHAIHNKVVKESIQAIHEVADELRGK